MRSIFLISLLLTIVSATVSLAQGTAQERSACMGDALRFCSSDIPFVGAIEACLETNESRLSPACRREFGPQKTTKLREEHFYR